MKVLYLFYPSVLCQGGRQGKSVGGPWERISKLHRRLSCVQSCIQRLLTIQQLHTQCDPPKAVLCIPGLVSVYPTVTWHLFQGSSSLTTCLDSHMWLIGRICWVLLLLSVWSTQLYRLAPVSSSHVFLGLSSHFYPFGVCQAGLHSNHSFWIGLSNSVTLTPKIVTEYQNQSGWKRPLRLSPTYDPTSPC